MAAQDRLSLNIDVDLLVDPRDVQVSDRKLSRKVETAVKRSLERATKNVAFEGSEVIFDPSIKLSPKAFGAYKASLRKESEEILQALNISTAAGGKQGIEGEIARRVAEGEKVSKRVQALSRTHSEKDLRLLNETSRAILDITNRQREYFKAVRASGEAYKRSLVPGNKLSREELQLLKDRFSMLKQLNQAYRRTESITKTKDFYGADNQQIRQQGIALKGLQAGAAASAGELSHLNKVIAPLNKGLGGMNEKLSQSSLLIRQFFRYAIGYGALYQMLAAIRALVGGIVELDKALFSIKAITAATNAEMVEISAAIKGVALSTKFSTTEIAKAAQVLAQAGVSPEEISKVLNSVASFAAGTETALSTAADVVSTMRNVFKDLDDLTIANQLTKAINISKLTGNDLKTILGISAQVAQQFNLTSEQYLAAVTTLRNAGLKASTVATGLRQGLLEIFSPDSKSTKDLIKRYQEIGEVMDPDRLRDKFHQFTQEANPLLSVLRELNRLGFVGEGRKTLARSLDIRAANAIRAMIENLDELEQSEARLVGGNSALDASATQMESLSNSIDNLGAAMTALSSDITEGPIRSLEDFIDTVTEVIVALDKLHIASLAAGGEGLLPAAQLGVGGGIAGTLLGRTPVGKVAGGLAGALGGGAAGIAGAGSEDYQRATAMAGEITLYLATVLPILFGLGKVSRAGVTKLQGAAQGSLSLKKIDKNVGIVGKFLAQAAILFAPLAGLARTAASFALRVVPWVAGITLAVDILDRIFGIFPSGTSELEELERRALGLEKQAIEQRQELEKSLARADAFRFSSKGKPATVGKTPAKIEAIADVQRKYQLLFDQLFGDVAEAEGTRIEDLIAQLGTREGSVAKSPLNVKLMEQIKAYLQKGNEVLSEVTAGQLQSVVALQSEIQNTAKGLRDDLNSTLANLYDKTDLSAADKALRDTLAAAITEEGIQDVLSGKGDILNAAAFVESIGKILKLGGEALIEAENIVEREQRQILTSIQAGNAELTRLVRSGAPGTQLRLTIDRLINEAQKTPETTERMLGALFTNLELVNLGLKKELVDLEKQGEKAEAELARRKIVGGELLTFLFGESDEALEARAKRGREARGQQEAIEAGIAKKEEAIAEPREAAREANVRQEKIIRSAVEAIAELSKKELGRMQDTLSKDLDLDAWVKRVRAADAAGIDEIVRELLTSGGANRLGQFAQTSRAQAKIALASLPPSQIKEQQEQFLPDIETQKRVAHLDTQIANAQKTKLALLTSDNELLNPILIKRNLILAELDRELAIARENLSIIESELKGDISAEARGKIHKARKAVVTLEIKRAKTESEADKKQFAARAKIEQAKLGLEKKEINARIATVNAAIKGTKDEGKLAELQKARWNLSMTLVDIENEKVEQLGYDTELTKKLVEAREREVEASLAAAEAQEQIALARKRIQQVAEGGPEVGDRAGQAYREAAGQAETRSQAAGKLQREISQVIGEIARLEDRMEKTPEGMAKYKEEIDGLVVKLAELTGTYETLTVQATAAFQLDKLTDLDTWIEKFQGLDSDITKLADNIQDRLVTAIDSIGESLVDTLLEGKDFLESMRETFYSMFRDMAVTSAKSFINEGVQALLGEESNILNLIPGGIGGSGKDAALIANTTALQNLTNALLVSQGKGGAVVAGDGGGLFGGLGRLFGGEDKNATGAEQAIESFGRLGNEDDRVVQAIDKQTNSMGGMFGNLGTTLTSAWDAVSSGFMGLFSGEGGGAGWLASIASWFGYAKGISRLKVPGFAGGTPGVITGPGTGTSDSIPGVAVSSLGQIVSPIAVSNGESILTARATQILGEGFINRINAGIAPLKFASGAVFSKMSDRPSSSEPSQRFSERGTGQPPVEVDASTKIINVLDEAMIPDAMSSSAGEKVILNVLRRNGFERTTS